MIRESLDVHADLVPQHVVLGLLLLLLLLLPRLVVCAGAELVFEQAQAAGEGGGCCD